MLKGMGENLRKIAMHITNEFVTQAVDENYRAGVATWCYFDEFHVLLRDQLTASYFVAVWKMLRKKGLCPQRIDAKCERPFSQRGDLKHSGQHRFHGAAVTGPE